MVFNLVDLENVRLEMISEIESDIKEEKLYLSDRLNADGQRDYPQKLLEAAKSMDIAGFIRTFGTNYFNSHFQRRNPKGGFTTVTMPSNANTTLCEGEFNRFYIRAVSIKALELGKTDVIVYRARHSDNPRPESIAIEGNSIDAKNLLIELRAEPNVEKALGLALPNSGMSVKL